MQGKGVRARKDARIPDASEHLRRPCCRAGKSTLLRIMAGVEDPDSGEVKRVGATRVGCVWLPCHRPLHAGMCRKGACFVLKMDLTTWHSKTHRIGRAAADLWRSTSCTVWDCGGSPLTSLWACAATWSRIPR